MHRKFQAFISVVLSFVTVFAAKTGTTEAAPPTNFQTTPVVTTGLEGPSGFEIAPDGRIFILERTGEVKIFKDGNLLSQPFAVLPSVTTGDRGLIGIAFDPDFFTNHYVYFYYTGEDLLNRLVRFDASGDVGTNGPVIIYQTSFPSEQLHVGGTIRFGPDGNMYFGVGDNGYPPNAQDLSNPHGKILRINKDGSIPTDNPFVGQSGALPEIWAYGFRNPWRFQFDESTNRLFVGDAGEATWEEVNLVTKGGNYGWPLSEGVCTANCEGFIDPIHTYNHNGLSSAITGGPLYRGGMFPTEYFGSYFFGDYARGFIQRLTFDSAGSVTGAVTFDSNAGSVVDMKVDADGSIYYLTYIPGALYRITYSTDNQAPTANASADVTKGIEPLTVTFSSDGTSDPNGDPLTYLWDFDDGTTSSEANPTKTYESPGKYIVTLKVSDGTYTAVSIPVVIQVGIPPTVTIGAPSDGDTYRAGDEVFYSANATDGAGFDISESDFTTEVLFHHGTHIHPFLGPITSKTGTFTIPRTGEPDTNQWYEVRITATDTNGLSTTGVVNIYPEAVNVRFESSPPGLKILVDGQPTDTSQTIPHVVGYEREVAPLDNQLLNGVYYQFDNWSDGGTPIHTITVPAGGMTLTANYREVPAFNGEYFTNRDLSGSPTLTRQDPIIDFNWGDGSPTPGLPVDNFSVRWSKDQYFAAGQYTFTTATDDGVRLFIDGNLVIDQWKDQGTTTYETVIDLATGNHTIVMEYYDSGGGAVARLHWALTGDSTTPPPPPPSGTYTGEYWNITGSIPDGIPTTAPTFTRDDTEITFDWGGGSPDPSITVDNFVARWTKTHTFDAGTYTFTTETDDGVRLYVDGNLIIDQWKDQGTTKYEAVIDLTAGDHEIRMEYYEHGGGAVAKMSFVQGGTTPPPPPTTGGFQGEYFDNMTLSGTPVLTRTDSEMTFVWNELSPDPALPADQFSVRWTKTEAFAAGTYTFTLKSDDGIRFWIDDQLIVDDWNDHGLFTHTPTVTLTEGEHILKIEYYENSGNAVAIFSQ